MKINKKKRLYNLCIICLVCFVCTFCFSACSNKKDTTNTKTIQDIYNRTVSVPEKVEKIATVGSATRMVVYAGATNKLVAVTEVDKVSELRPYTMAYSEKFEKLPTTNNGNHINTTTVDKEKLISLKPDVILSSRSADECESLQNDINIPVVGVYFQDELFSDNVYNSIDIVGKVAGTQQHASDTINYIKSVQKDLDVRCKQNSTKLYRGAVNFKGSKNLNGTISNYCVYKAIKANNVADKEGINSAYDTNLEQILSWNPDYIFMDSTNSEKIKTQIVNNRSAVSKIQALNNDHAYYVAPFNNNGTNIEFGLCEAYYTAKTIDETAFSDINIDEKFGEIFEKLIGKNIYDELKNKGIYFGKAEF